jgi:hypothetical protein
MTAYLLLLIFLSGCTGRFMTLLVHPRTGERKECEALGVNAFGETIGASVRHT